MVYVWEDDPMGRESRLMLRGVPVGIQDTGIRVVRYAEDRWRIQAGGSSFPVETYESMEAAKRTALRLLECS